MEVYLPRSIYRIPFVQRGKEDIWRKYWMRPLELSKNARSANRDGSLGRSDLIDANSIQEAVAILESRHPDCSAMPERGERIGDA
jgi:hypothetical protein